MSTLSLIYGKIVSNMVLLVSDANLEKPRKINKNRESLENKGIPEICRRWDLNTTTMPKNPYYMRFFSKIVNRIVNFLFGFQKANFVNCNLANLIWIKRICVYSFHDVISSPSTHPHCMCIRYTYVVHV